jgi:hypothetical protein
MSSLDAGLSAAAVAFTPATVLRLLAATSEVAAVDPAELPQVCIHLSSGQLLDGQLVRVGTDHGHEVVLLAVGPEIAYLQMADVRAVTVHAPERYRDVLTGGALPPPVTGTPVSRAALRRDFAPSPDFPLETGWDELPDSAEALANLAQLLSKLRTAIEEVRADALGRQSWAQVRALHLAHQAGSTLSVHRVPDGLAVQADLTAALPRDLAGELRRQLNSVL